MDKLQKLLISSKFAKDLSVKIVSENNFVKNIPEIDPILISTPRKKFVLANQLILNGKSRFILRPFISYLTGTQSPVGITRIKDSAKQMLTYLALYSQWVESNIY